MHKLKKDNRLSNYELLRIVAMILIMTSHIFMHGINPYIFNSNYTPAGQMFNQPRLFIQLVVTYIGRSFGGVGNAIFILLSGYFLIEKEHIDLIKQIKKLLTQVLFASAFLTLISFVYMNFDNTSTFEVDIRAFNNEWWFVGYYILVIFIAEFSLNKLAKRINKKDYLTILLVLFSIVSLGFTRTILSSFAKDFDIVISGIFMYLLGGFIKKFNPFKMIKVYVIILILIFNYIFIIVSYCNFTLSNVHQVLIDQGSDFVQVEYAFYGNYQLSGFISAICLFELFSRIRINQINFLNYVASATFMMYLFHENSLIWGLLLQIKWNEILFNRNYFGFLGYILALIILYMIIGVMVFALYRFFEWLLTRQIAK